MQSFLFRNRWLRRLVITLAVFVLLLLLLWALVPGIAKSQLEKQASARLGRAVTVGRVEFSPWSLELTLRDLRVARAAQEGASAQDEPSTSQFQVDRIYVNASIQSLLRLMPVLDAIEVDAPVLRLTQRSLGHFDVDDVLARLSQPSDPEPSGPVGFALYNIALSDGRVELQDDLQERQHTLDQLQLRLPFISNLESKRDIKVLPHLSFALNGSRFESSAQSTPFTDQRRTAVDLSWQGVDLAPYLGYVPSSAPIRPSAGVLDTNLHIAFEQDPQAVVRISGEISLSGAELRDREGAPLLRFERLAAVLKNVQPLQSIAELESVQWSAPEVFASRDARGRINWLSAAQGPAAVDGAAADAPQQAPDKPTDARQPWQVALGRLVIADATVHWRDAAPDAGKAGAALQARQLSVHARDIRWPMEQPLSFDAGLLLQAGAAAPDAKPAQLMLSGALTDKQGRLAISARQLPLQLAAPYLSAHLAPELSGVLETDAGLGWNGSAMVAHVARLAVEQLSLKDRVAPVAVAQLQLDQVQVDLARQQVAVGRVALQKPQVAVARDTQGRWMYEQWLPTTAPAPVPPGPGKAASRPWALKLQAVEVDGGAVTLRDAAPMRGADAPRSVSLDLSSLRLRLGAIEPLAARQATTPLELSAHVGSGRRVQAGSLSLRGDLGLAPLSLQGKVQARSLPLHALEPYFADLLNVELVRADGNFTGQLRFASLPVGPELAVQGDVELSELRMRSALASPVQAADAAPAAPRSAAGAVAAVLSESTADRAASSGLGLRDELLAWKTLAVRGLDLQMQPAQPLRLSVRETALSDFFARVIVQRNGRINLQDIVKSAKSEQSLAQNAVPAADGAGTSAQAASAAVPASGPAPIVNVGPIVLTGGRVQFSDYFIQPNYSADLSELAGRLSAFSSQQTSGQQGPQLADVELRGRAQGTAFLEITGQVNPLAKPLALDIRAQMRDLELPPLSPYSIKYAGHGIERGKLSMDVDYKIEPDGQLTARNKLVLHQLTFGEPVQGAPASLPVRLAVALLADRNGVIDLDLPVSGSLNDPQFRLAPVIFKIIGNLIMKAVTAPFSLLSGAFGGSSESGVVAFAPGRAQIDAKARESLDKVVASLKERPALKLTVIGEAREAQDREAWKQAQLDRLLLAQKRRQALRDGRSAESVTEVSEAEVPTLTKALYSRSDFAKPRNVIGMAKDLPTDQMRSLLLAQISVPDDAMRELALARGVAVRDYLAQQQLPLERLFLGAPRLDSQDQEWSPRAQLSLSTQ
ncbi:Uncharacterized protein involved in outer membrane biogenesis [Delftia tsuruhatensis]|uniref:DUF748 domain-containing protein n=1 Tax=Delftia tsuruhatensis TaxID=180282 RepID=UPI001E739832|nr:DUF748 domain-containing protein [Delftia tsuruhatensis]CAB5661196.1 Uncharacterized protein involved in outer membrane biogenesis [Delftia tsuruhatensis]CAC9680044.1 Uncharacterized protein involved in outer membrane biogenesis [Delftia tsuruhatensis]